MQFTMNYKLVTNRKIIVIFQIAILLIVTLSNFTFAMETEDEFIELSNIQRQSPHSSEALSKDEEVDHFGQGKVEDPICSLDLAISEKLPVLDHQPRFSLRELPPYLGSVFGIPLSEFAVKRAGESLFLKAYLKGSTIVSVGITRVWALDALINEVWHKSKHRPRTHVIVNMLSALSALPITYAVWNETHNVIFACISYLSEWNLATLGFYEVSNKFQGLRSNQDHGEAAYRELPNSRDLSKTVRQFYKYLLSSPDPDTFADELITSINEPDHEPGSLIRLAELPYPRAKKVVKGIFYGIPVASLVVNSVLAYQSISQFSTSPFIFVPYMALTTIPIFALQLYITSSSVDDLWGDTVNKRSYFKAKARKCYYNTLVLSLLVSSGSAMWIVELIDSAFKGTFLKPSTTFFMCTTAVQWVIFESHCIRDYVAKKFFHYKEVKGSNVEKQNTTLITVLGEINNVADNTPSEGYAWYNPIACCQRAYTWVRDCCHQTQH